MISIHKINIALLIVCMTLGLIILLSGCSSTSDIKPQPVSVITKTCDAPLLTNESAVSWKAEDDAAVGMATSGCKRKYGVDACLVSLTKVAVRTYRASCLRGVK